MLFYLDLLGKNSRQKNLKSKIFKQKLSHQVVETKALTVEAEAIQNCRIYMHIRVYQKNPTCSDFAITWQNGAFGWENTCGKIFRKSNVIWRPRSDVIVSVGGRDPKI